MTESASRRIGGNMSRRTHLCAMAFMLTLTGLGTGVAYSMDADLGARPELLPGNSASVYQFGQKNSTAVQQQGASNTAWFGQSGSDNAINATQQGHGNLGTLTQAGAENMISLAQYDKTNYAAAAQNGYANNASVAQYNTFGDARIAQDGNLNSAAVITLSAGAPPVKINQYGNGAFAKVIQY